MANWIPQTRLFSGSREMNPGFRVARYRLEVAAGA